MTGPFVRSVDEMDRVLAGLTEHADLGRPVDVLDVGGGSGTRAVPLAVRGCTVTVVDTSIDALAMLRRRAAEAGVADRVRAVQADADGLDAVIPTDSADLVLCHHLLESVDDPAETVRGLARVTRPGGLLSIVVPGRYAAVLIHAMNGRYADAAAVLADPAGRFGPQDPLLRRFDVAAITALLVDAGLDVGTVTGLGVVPALARADGAPWPGAGEALSDLEAALSMDGVLREIATDLHVPARRPVA
jgi:SAM-dependent methyltransferase